MARNNRAKYTDNLAIKAWRRRNVDKVLCHDLAKEMKVSRDSLRNWINKVDATPKLLSIARGQDTPKPADKRKETSKSDEMREWLGKHPLGTRDEFIKDTKIQVSGSHFSTIRTKMGENRITKKSKSDHAVVNDHIKQFKKMKEDNAFLQWWNTGERNGFVDRLLREVAK